MTLHQVNRFGELPEMDFFWIRGKNHKIDFKRPWTFLNLGLKGSGKSALLETLGCFYPKVVDLFGSRDSEGLGWCRSPFQDDVQFLIGDSVDVDSCWDTKRISELRIEDFEDYRINLCVSAFFLGICLKNLSC